MQKKCVVRGSSGVDFGNGGETVWRVGFKYEDMEKFKLLPEEYATESEARMAADVLISSKPFKTIVCKRPKKENAAHEG